MGTARSKLFRDKKTFKRVVEHCCFHKKHISIERQVIKHDCELLVFGFARYVIQKVLKYNYGCSELATIIFMYFYGKENQPSFAFTFNIKRTRYIDSPIDDWTLPDYYNAKSYILFKQSLRLHPRTIITIQNNQCTMKNVFPSTESKHKDICNAFYYNIELNVLGIQKTDNKNFETHFETLQKIIDERLFGVLDPSLTSGVYFLTHCKGLIRKSGIDPKYIRQHGFKFRHQFTGMHHQYNGKAFSIIPQLNNRSKYGFQCCGSFFIPNDGIPNQMSTYNYNDLVLDAGGYQSNLNKHFETMIEMRFDKNRNELSFWKHITNDENQLDANIDLYDNDVEQSDTNIDKDVCAVSIDAVMIGNKTIRHLATKNKTLEMGKDKEATYEKGVFYLDKNFEYFPFIASVGCDCCDKGVVVKVVRY